MSEILQDTTKCIRTSTRSSGSELAAGLCRSSVSGRLTRPPNTSLQVPAQRHPERQSVKRPWARSCRCRVHAAAGRPKPLKERARGIPNDKKPPHRPHQTRARSLHPSPRSSRKALREHNRSSAETFAVAETPGVSFFPEEGGGGEHQPSKHPRSTRRTQRSIPHSVECRCSHTPPPDGPALGTSKKRAGRGRAGQDHVPLHPKRKNRAGVHHHHALPKPSARWLYRTEPNRPEQKQRDEGAAQWGFFFRSECRRGKGSSKMER